MATPTTVDLLIGTRIRGMRLLNNMSQERLGDYDQAIKLKPTDCEIYYNCGLAKKANGDASGAADDFAKAKAPDPNLGK